VARDGRSKASLFRKGVSRMQSNRQNSPKAQEDGALGWDRVKAWETGVVGQFGPLPKPEST